MNQSIINALLLSVMAVGSTACTHLEPTRVSRDFGNSNRSMINNQLFDAKTSMEPSEAATTGLDGNKAGRIIEAYRVDNSTRNFGDAKVNTNSVTQGN